MSTQRDPTAEELNNPPGAPLVRWGASSRYDTGGPGTPWFAGQSYPDAQGPGNVADRPAREVPGLRDLLLGPSVPDGPNAPWERHLAKSYPTPESRAAFDHEVRKTTERAKTANGTRPLGSPPGSVPPKPSRG